MAAAPPPPPPVAADDGDLAALLAQHPSLQPNERGKLRCALTGHELPRRADAVRQFVAGKAYAHARAWYAADFGRYEPFIVPHKRDAKKLWCRLTGHELNRIPEEVEAHVAGRRYRLRLAEAQARKAKGRDPFAAPAEGGGGDGDDGEEGDLDMVEFGLIDGEEGQEGSAAAGPGSDDDVAAADAACPLPGSNSGGTGAQKRRPTTAMDEDEGDEGDGDDDDGDDDSDDSGIEVDDEFFAGNDAALAAVGIIKLPKAKKKAAAQRPAEQAGGARRAKPAPAATAARSDDDARARVTGKHSRASGGGGGSLKRART